MRVDSGSLHHAIISEFVERGFAPTPAELGARFQASSSEISAALKGLADDHGVVLHPNSDHIWIAHPFSNAPTGFLVRAGDREWWGNCTWCSLGAVQLVGGNVEIVTALGGSGDQVTLRIKDGDLLDTDYVVHFPIKMANAWDNVVYTCSMMLLFENSAQVDLWCQKHSKPKGDVRSVAQIWRFAQEWYGRHLDLDWRKWTAEEAAAMFKKHGLDGPVWDIPEAEGRF